DTYDEMQKLIKPTAYAGGWEAVLKPVNWSTVRMPTSEEVWLSLEDMCVRREVLKILQLANKTSSVFAEDKAAKDLPASKMGPKFSKRWVNRIYQIDLTMNEESRGRYVFSGKV